MSDVARFRRHPRWREILWVVGYVDAHGAVHAHIVFQGDKDRPDHAGMGVPKYKTWRWNRQGGLEKSSLCAVNPDDDDVNAIMAWLRKHGCLNDWEL
jgi:hypothetical protein